MSSNECILLLQNFTYTFFMTHHLMLEKFWYNLSSPLLVCLAYVCLFIAFFIIIPWKTLSVDLNEPALGLHGKILVVRGTG